MLPNYHKQTQSSSQPGRRSLSVLAITVKATQSFSGLLCVHYVVTPWQPDTCELSAESFSCNLHPSQNLIISDTTRLHLGRIRFVPKDPESVDYTLK